MIRFLILAAILSGPLGCAHERESVARSEPAPAYRKLDRAADRIGQVLYPPLCLAAFPLWFLSGNK